MDALTITCESPLGDDLALIFQRHAAEMFAHSPPESIHMMARGDLDHPTISFYALREAGRPVAMGAIKIIAPGHGEIKSMHVLQEDRGRGLSRDLLHHLLAAARDKGLSRLSLETGAQPAFAAARALYARAGFAECAPFASYRPDPHSVFMTRDL